MAESADRPCFQCDKNPRIAGDIFCKSCKEEIDVCYECGERQRNHPFYLCTPCYQASRSPRSGHRAASPAITTAGRSPEVSPKAVQPAASPTCKHKREAASARTASAPHSTEEEESICILPGCSKPKYTDKLSGYVHDFCGKTHADEYKNSFGVVPPRREPTATLLRLRKDQTTHKDLVALFKKEWVKTSEAYPNPPELTAIYAIQNPWLVERFQLYGSRIRQGTTSSNSQHFFHGTTVKCNLLTTNTCCTDPDCGICGISQRGFDPSKIGTNISWFKRFGHGIYLAPNSSKCHDYTQGMAEHGFRAQLLCLVACGARSEQLWDNTKLVEPPSTFHSVHGKSGGSLNYDEVVVYDVDAVLPQFIIVYEHDGVDKIAK